MSPAARGRFAARVAALLGAALVAAGTLIVVTATRAPAAITPDAPAE